jgi:hypothetical protein
MEQRIVFLENRGITNYKPVSLISRDRGSKNPLAQEIPVLSFYRKAAYVITFYIYLR